MAFENICLSTTGDISDNRIVRVHASEPTNPSYANVCNPGSSLYVGWTTTYGHDAIGYFDVAIIWKGLIKNQNESNGWTDWSSEYYQRFDASECNETSYGGRVAWHHNLDIKGMLSDVINSGSWNYSKRKYDAVLMQIRFDSVDTNGNKFNVQTSQWLKVIYAPAVTISKAQATANGLRLTLSCSSDWQRKDDTFVLKEFTAYNKTRYNVTTSLMGYDSDASTRTYVMDVDPIIGVVMPETPYYAKYELIPAAEVAAVQKNYDYYWTTQSATTAEAGKCCSIDVASTTIDDKTMSARVYLTIAWGEHSSKNYNYTTSITGVMKTQVPFDTDTVTKTVLMENGNTAYIDFDDIPFNTETTLEFTPSGENFSFNDTISTTVLISSNHAVISSTEADSAIHLYYDVLDSRTITPSANFVQLAGRTRPSAFYGTGTEITHSLTATIVESPGAYSKFENIPYNVEIQNGEEFEDVAMSGDCVLRTTDGMRRAVAITDYSIQSKDKTIPYVKNISINMKEVDR
jgi:hypothetical protein